MCGLAGFFSPPGTYTHQGGLSILEHMGEAIAHRGPDDHGEFFHVESGFGISFRRLAILDLSPTGHQPMTSHSKRYTMAYNGEVYNYQRLTSELEAEGKLPPLRGSSDSEIMLAAFEAWGIQAAVKRFIGMFAIALWDHHESCAYLIRDRVGVKPLYYGVFGQTIVFGSELKALRAHPDFRADVDRNTLATFLRFSYVPEPHCIYQGVKKLPAGTILRLPSSNCFEDPLPYWELNLAASNSIVQTESEREIVNSLEELLTDCVGLRMLSDVPLGAFLSGGVDSSLVVALMQSQSSSPVKTFSVGFSKGEYDEAAFAKQVAIHLKTDHIEHYVNDQDALEVVPLLSSMFDEPFADPSQIPTYLVSKMARQHVTVSLSGDGGDELFAGYNRYSVALQLWKLKQRYPRQIRSMLAGMLGVLPPRVWERMFRSVQWALPSSFGIRRIDERIDVMRAGLTSEDPMSLYRSLMSHVHSPNGVVQNGNEYEIPEFTESKIESISDFLASMMLCDMATYMQEDVLAKVDRCSMAVSLEAREPLLDHRLIEFALSLPMELRSQASGTKRLLKAVLYRHVPKELIERPKQGFAAPIGDWINGSLRVWADELLDPRRLDSEGFFHAQPIQQMLLEHRSGKRNWQFALWNVLMFQAWLETNHPVSNESNVSSL